MSGPNEVLSRFGELEDAIKTHYGKVDPRLLVDMIDKEVAKRILSILLKFS